MSQNANINTKPLVTFALFAYNQEQFVADAVKGALAQDYQPLEIILSDDCSTDETFDVMQRTAADYQGPHEVILNRNPTNLGLIGHLNRILAHAKGHLIVIAGGDDISLPDRTSINVGEWLQRDVMIVYSNAFTIDRQGNRTGQWFNHNPKPWLTVDDFLTAHAFFVLGCANAIDRRLIDTFDPIPDGVLQEDWVLPFRSVLLGKIRYVDLPLVEYRRHGQNTWQTRDAAAYYRLVEQRSHIYEAWLGDLKKVGHSRENEIRSRINRLIRRNAIEIRVRSIPFLGKYLIAFRLFIKRSWHKVVRLIRPEIPDGPDDRSTLTTS